MEQQQQLTVAALSRWRETLLLALYSGCREEEAEKESLQTRLLRLCSYHDEVRERSCLCSP